MERILSDFSDSSSPDSMFCSKFYAITHSDATGEEKIEQGDHPQNGQTRAVIDTASHTERPWRDNAVQGMQSNCAYAHEKPNADNRILG